MKLAVFVEGPTEGCLREFLSRWLRQKNIPGVGIYIRQFNGAGNYLAEIQQRASRVLDTPDVIGAIGILDFYGSTLEYAAGSVTTQYQSAKQQIERGVNRVNFRQHFAVHETEAWLFSDTTVFPSEIRNDLPKTDRPESVNHGNPPSHRLKEVYWRRLGRKYKKPIEGQSLFRKLDPEVAYQRCPHLRLLLDDILTFAKRAP